MARWSPTSGSWLNAVETFFSALTRRRLKRGVLRSIVELQAALKRYFADHNEDSKPFTRTKTPTRDASVRSSESVIVHEPSPRLESGVQIYAPECHIFFISGSNRDCA
jgi:hypothetical protein